MTTAAAFAGSVASSASFVTGEPEAPVASSHFTLEWTAGGDEETVYHFELRQDADPAFADYRIRYEGPDRASFLAGLPEGEHFFQVRATDSGGEAAGPWSETFTLTIRYQSLILAYALFVLGAVVFLATLILVVAGRAKARREEKVETAERGAFSGPS